MAKFSNSSGSLYLNVYVEQGSQSITDNTSTVNWRMTVSRTGAYYTRNQQGDSTLSLNLDGRNVHYSYPTWETSGEEYTLASGSSTISHNADGTKTLPISCTFNPNNGLHGTITVSASLSLTTIPRSSSVSVSPGVIGSSVTININRQSSSFKHTVRYAWAGKSGTIATNVDTSTTWTIPLDFASDIPNSASGTGTIYVDTYSGSTKTGTQSTTLTASVPANVKPTFTGVSLSDLNGAAQNLIPNGNTFIQVISNIKVAFNGAVGSYGSSITGYYAEIVGKNQSTSSNGGSLGIMNYHGTIKIRASVSDSRGRWSDAREVSVTVLEYFAPALSFSIARTGSTSSTLTVTRNAKIAPLATESVVLSYDRSGVGVNKIRERGALDVKGDIYANDQPVQQYQLSSNAGGPLWFDGKPNVTNANLLDRPGQYYIANNAKGNPNGQWGYLFHYSNYGKNDGGYKEAIQLFYGNNGQVYFRHHRWSKTIDDWEDWKEYATKDDIQKYTQDSAWQVLPLQNSWVHHPNYDKVQYSKTFDGVVYIRGTAYKGRTTKETVIGVLPVGFRPKQTMFVLALNNSYGVAVLGLYSSGNIVVKENVDATWLNFDNVSFKI